MAATLSLSFSISFSLSFSLSHVPARPGQRQGQKKSNYSCKGAGAGLASMRGLEPKRDGDKRFDSSNATADHAILGEQLTRRKPWQKMRSAVP